MLNFYVVEKVTNFVHLNLLKLKLNDCYCYVRDQSQYENPSNTWRRPPVEEVYFELFVIFSPELLCSCDSLQLFFL